MGFPENKKLAKDINKNTEQCSSQLEALLSAINSQMGLMNSLISSISGGYVSKDYVDSGDNVVREEYKAADNILQTKIDAINNALSKERYVASDTEIATITFDVSGLGYGNSKKSTNSFTALYDGVVKYKYSAQYSGGGFDKFYLRIYKSDDTNTPILTHNPTLATVYTEYNLTFRVESGKSYYVRVSNSSGSSGDTVQFNQKHSIGADIGNGW